MDRVYVQVCNWNAKTEKMRTNVRRPDLPRLNACDLKAVTLNDAEHVSAESTIMEQRIRDAQDKENRDRYAGQPDKKLLVLEVCVEMSHM